MHRIILYCFLMSFFTVVHCEQRKIEEQNICQMAQLKNLPIALVLLRGDHCPWSQKLQKDVLTDVFFQEHIHESAVLWTLNSDEITEQKYDIKEFPQVLLLDPLGKEFARFGYLPLTAQGYLDEMKRLIQNFQDVCIALDREKENPLDEEQWIELYRKATTLSMPYFKQVILEKGLKKEKGDFFHLEKLANALAKNKIKNPQILKLKTDLLKRDPENKRGTHYKVALLEFQKAVTRHKSKGRIERVLKPLIQYIQGIGKRDAENLWKAEMAVAEFLFEKKALSSAIEHMQAAYDAAPEAVKPKVADALLLMKN